jgi:hypothetical protein|tara:strand:- start:1605 stop:1757 length:153 start_codon:yes stop_codon:yes gene_type:complete
MKNRKKRTLILNEEEAQEVVAETPAEPAPQEEALEAPESEEEEPKKKGWF